MKKLLIFSFILFSSFTLFGCQKKDNIDELSANLTCYEMEINLDVENKSATVVQNIDYVNNTDDILKVIKLHLYPQFFTEGATYMSTPSTKMNLAYPNGMSYAEYNIDRIRVDNSDISIKYENDFDSILAVDLGSSLLPDERVCISIEYSFTLPNAEHRFGYGDDTINLANFYPIICVYEDNEFSTLGYHPNGDPFYSDMANYLVSITLDEQYIVAGTGESNIEYIDNQKKVTFRANLVRDFAMVISEKFEILSETVNDTTISYYYYDDEDKEYSLKACVDALTTFNELFGQYPYPTLSVVKNDFVYGGMEYPNLVMISDNIDNLDDYMNVIIHEIAHQWWYGMVGNDAYTYPWLDEALTEYSTLLFYDQNDDYTFTHEYMLEVNKSNYTLFITVYEDVLGTIDTSMRAVDLYNTDPEYTYCTYVKGVLMYESLYQLIGEKDFLNALQFYFDNNKYSNTTPIDLILAFEDCSGKDLENFFDSWITGKVIIR